MAIGQLERSESVNSAYPETFAPPEVAPITLQEKKEAAEHLLVMLSKCKNPTTGKIYTYPELAVLFHCSTRVIHRKLSERGVNHQPVPEVRRDDLPANEKAFFLGLALGDYSVGKIHWGRQDFVTIDTEATSTRRRELLKKTVGHWGELHERTNGVRIYVDYPKFDFMISPSVDAKFLAARERFAPFMLGALTARLSTLENRLSLSNEALLRRIHGTFSTCFGFPLGRFNVEHRTPKPTDEGPAGNKLKIPVVSIKNPGEVFGALLQVKSVAALPFLPEVARIS